MSSENKEVDYSLANPDTLTKYKTAAQISEKVLAEVSKLVVPGAKIVDICQQGDKLIEEEISKVYRGKKINKGFSHPTTVSPSSYVTPYTPLTSDEAEAGAEIKDGEAIKIQLGAQIDGFGSIVCDTIIATPEDKAGDKITGRTADLVLANYYINEVLLRLMIPLALWPKAPTRRRPRLLPRKPLHRPRSPAFSRRSPRPTRPTSSRAPPRGSSTTMRSKAARRLSFPLQRAPRARVSLKLVRFGVLRSVSAWAPARSRDLTSVPLFTAAPTRLMA
ncbi:hypothetical protein NXS19_011976 [Fusarium pseudograminearum]|nr:hypothetical protein NXS19_011976 [Fusarium pseudograminearum]